LADTFFSCRLYLILLQSSTLLSLFFKAINTLGLRVAVSPNDSRAKKAVFCDVTRKQLTVVHAVKAGCVFLIYFILLFLLQPAKVDEGIGVAALKATSQSTLSLNVSTAESKSRRLGIGKSSCLRCSLMQIETLSHANGCC